MAVTKANRLAVLAQVRRNVQDPAVISQFESYLDDNNPLGDSLQQMFFAQSDYTKNMQAIQAEKQKLESERAKLATDYQNLQSWRTTVEQTELTAKQQAAQVEQAARQKLEELRTKAKNESLTFDDFSWNPTLAPVTTTTSTTSTTSTAPPQRPMSPSQTNPYAQASANSTPNPPALSPDDAGRQLIKGVTGLFSLATQHRKLFNEDLDMDALADMALDQGRDIKSIYDELYNPTGKIKEIEQQQFQAAVQAEANKLFEEKMASFVDPSGKAAHPGDFSRIMIDPSPVFANMGHTAKDFGINVQNAQNTQAMQPQEQSQTPAQSASQSHISQQMSDVEIAKEFLANLSAPR